MADEPQQTIGETPPAEFVRTPVDINRYESGATTIWLADGSRLFCHTAPAAIVRVEGLKDDNGNPVYQINWSINVITKGPRSK